MKKSDTYTNDNNDNNNTIDEMNNDQLIMTKIRDCNNGNTHNHNDITIVTMALTLMIVMITTITTMSIMILLIIAMKMINVRFKSSSPPASFLMKFPTFATFPTSASLDLYHFIEFFSSTAQTFPSIFLSLSNHTWYHQKHQKINKII